jgi:hypothetical protein
MLPSRAVYGHHDAKVCALGNLSRLCWIVGKLRQALTADAQTLS